MADLWREELRMSTSPLGWLPTRKQLRAGRTLSGHLAWLVSILACFTLLGTRPANAQGSIACGQTIHGSIEALGDTDIFVFNAQQGEVVSITLGEVSGSSEYFTPRWALLDPSKALVNDADGDPLERCSGQCESAPLPLTGRYEIRVFDYLHNSTGTYNLTLEAISATFGGVSNSPDTPVCQRGLDGTQPIPCGETLWREIGGIGETDTFTFIASEGEVVSITVGKVSDTSGDFDPRWTLFDPTGTRVNDAGGYPLERCASQCESAPLPLTGTYTIKVFDSWHNYTGTYNLTLEAVSATFGGVSNGPETPVCQRGLDGTQPIHCGETLGREIEISGETDTFTFIASEGEVVSITIGEVSDPSGDFDPRWILFDPTGTAVDAPWGLPLFCSGQCESAPLPLTGTYTIKVFDYFHSATGTYNLTLEAISATFGGVSNGPETPVCQRGLDGTQPIHCGETLGREIDGVGETDTFTFMASEGEVVSITVEEPSDPSGDFWPFWALFDPTGTLVNDARGYPLDYCWGQCESAPLPLTGTYTIKVFEDSHSATGTYTLTLEAVSATFGGVSNGPETPVCQRGLDGTQPIHCGETLEREVDRGGETDTFTFIASESEVVSITVEEASAPSGYFWPDWALFDPTGTQISPLNYCPGQCESDPLPLTGTYTIKVFESWHNSTGTYNLTLEAISATFGGVSNGPETPVCQRGLDGTQPIRCGETLWREIAGIGETDTFTFMASEGEVVSITVEEVSDPSGDFSPRWSLFDPTGMVVDDPTGNFPLYRRWGQRESAPLPLTGTYTIKVFDQERAFEPGYTGTYSVTLNSIPPCVSACDDGLDNDGDGLIDYPNDPGCTDGSDGSEKDSSLPCDDGADNDNDGRIDFDPVTFADPGDETILPSGFGDPGCKHPKWFSEDPRCQNGIDDDGDGTMDYDAGLSRNGVADPGGPDLYCVDVQHSYGNKESRCGLGAELALLLPPLMWFYRGRRQTA